jgi:hypothetical protein
MKQGHFGLSPIIFIFFNSEKCRNGERGLDGGFASKKTRPFLQSPNKPFSQLEFKENSFYSCPIFFWWRSVLLVRQVLDPSTADRARHPPLPAPRRSTSSSTVSASLTVASTRRPPQRLLRPRATVATDSHTCGSGTQ